MSGFSSEQPKLVTGGMLQQPTYFGPQPTVTGIYPSGGISMPYGHIPSTERPCGGIGGYDAAANEAERLRKAAIGAQDHLASFSSKIASAPPQMERFVKSGWDDLARYEETERRLMDERVTRMVFQTNLEIEGPRVVHRSGPLTVYEQTGNSHVSHVANRGFHITTQVPGLGKDAGLDQGLPFHTYVKPDKKGRLIFDSEY